MALATTPTSLEFGALLTGLSGGLALFLYGMRLMTESLKAVAGGGMKRILARLTSNRFKAAFAGALVTAVIQSSSVTTVLVVGFISAGLMNLTQSVGVIIGANVGTTVTAQIIAFKVYQYGLLMIAVGFLAEVCVSHEKIKQWGTALMGLGLLFFGMELMGAATGPLRTWPPFLDMMRHMQNPLLGIAVGALFTAIVQSSSATTGIVIVLASQGFITLESGIALILGSNIGTCVTAMLSAVGRPREAVQAAVVHVLFNSLGVLVLAFFVAPFAQFVRFVSPVSDQTDAAMRIAAESPRQIANAHTIFNVGNAFFFIWLTGPLARLVDRLVPVRKKAGGIRPAYLEDYYLEEPAFALDQVRRELVRLAELDRDNLQRVLRVATMGTRADVASLRRADDDVDNLYGAIITFLGRLSQCNLAKPQSIEVYQFIGIANYLENFGDVIESNLLEDAGKRLNKGVAVSPSTMDVLRPIHEKVVWAFERMLDGLRNGDSGAAQEAADSKAVVNELADAATEHLAKRLVAGEPNRLVAFQIETDTIENFKRLNTLTRRIARSILEVQALTDGHDKRTSPKDEPT